MKFRTKFMSFIAVLGLAMTVVAPASAGAATSTTVDLRGRTGTCTHYIAGEGSERGHVSFSAAGYRTFNVGIRASHLPRNRDFDVIVEEPTKVGGVIVGCTYFTIGSTWANYDGVMRWSGPLVYDNGGIHRPRIVLIDGRYADYLTLRVFATKTVYLNAG